MKVDRKIDELVRLAYKHANEIYSEPREVNDGSDEHFGLTYYSPQYKEPPIVFLASDTEAMAQQLLFELLQAEEAERKVSWSFNNEDN